MENLIIQEHKSTSYAPRTYYNAKSADLTLAIAVDLTTFGELLTKKAAGDNYVGYKLEEDTSTVMIARELYKKLKSTQSKTLNIAGNGIHTLHKHQCNQSFINQFVYEVIAQVHYHYPINKIYTGGQTGVDLAGAVCGYTLGIPTEVMLPHGFRQRFENGKDVNGTAQAIERQITEGASSLNLYVPILKKRQHEKPTIK